MAGWITELGYLGLEVSKLDEWEHFAGEVLGLGVKPGPTAATRLLRMDAHDRRIILSEGPADDYAYAGWQLADDAAFDAFTGHLDRMGVSHVTATDDELALRGVDRMRHFNDPLGNRQEAYCGPLLAAERFVSPKVASGFVTGAGGMGHIVMLTLQYQKSIEFAQKVLGFCISDYIRMQVAPEMKLEFAFLHANPRHHSLAFAQVPAPKRMHHFMVEVGDMQDVGRARDRCLAMGLPMGMDIGHHPNDQMTSFYGVTPSGFLVEFGCGGVLVDDATWQVKSYPQISEWGHRPLAVPPRMGSGPEGPAGNEPPAH